MKLTNRCIFAAATTCAMLYGMGAAHASAPAGHKTLEMTLTTNVPIRAPSVAFVHDFRGGNVQLSVDADGTVGAISDTVEIVSMSPVNAKLMDLAMLTHEDNRTHTALKVEINKTAITTDQSVRVSNGMPNKDTPYQTEIRIVALDKLQKPGNYAGTVALEFTAVEHATQSASAG